MWFPYLEMLTEREIPEMPTAFYLGNAAPGLRGPRETGGLAKMLRLFVATLNRDAHTHTQHLCELSFLSLLFVSMLNSTSAIFRQGQMGPWSNGAGAIIAIVATIASIAIVIIN